MRLAAHSARSARRRGSVRPGRAPQPDVAPLRSVTASRSVAAARTRTAVTALRLRVIAGRNQERRDPRRRQTRPTASAPARPGSGRRAPARDEATGPIAVRRRADTGKSRRLSAFPTTDSPVKLASRTPESALAIADRRCGPPRRRDPRSPSVVASWRSTARSSVRARSPSARLPRRGSRRSCSAGMTRSEPVTRPAWRRRRCATPSRSSTAATSRLGGPARPEEPTPAADEPDLARRARPGACKRALEIAAAGGHNVLLVGRPGRQTDARARLAAILPRSRATS